jgi:hypothetical protein
MRAMPNGRNTQPPKLDTTEKLRRRMRDAGFHPIPCLGKVPKFKDWETVGSASNAVIKRWTNGNFGHMTNTGLIAKTTPALDIDILDPTAVKAAVALVRKRYAGKGLILKRIGLPPKALIPFRTSAPFPKIKIQLMPPNATKVTKAQGLEFLCDGQQFITSGIHPDTKLPYVWDKAGEPGDVRRDQLPSITSDEANQLGDELTKLLIDRFGFTFKSKTQREIATAKSRPVRQALNVWQRLGLPDIDDVASAMQAIPNADEHYDEWKAMALRIYASTGGSDAGFLIWDTWSKLSVIKYRRYKTRAEWNVMRRSPPSRTGPGAIFALAREHGWEGHLEFKRQLPSLPCAIKRVALPMDQQRKRQREHLARAFEPSLG